MCNRNTKRKKRNKRVVRNNNVLIFPNKYHTQIHKAGKTKQDKCHKYNIKAYHFQTTNKSKKN